MNEEILEPVLKEVMDDLKNISKELAEQKRALQQLSTQIQGIDKKVEHQSTNIPPVNLEPIRRSIALGIDQITQNINQQPKPIIRQYRFLLFPAEYAKEYYRIVFGRLIFWMIFAMIISFSFVLGKQYIQGTIEIHREQLETNQYVKAWNYLYQHESKSGKRKMEEAFGRNY
jgi:hypothetical protein